MTAVTQQRYGITVPFPECPCTSTASWYEELAELGYTDLWSSEAGSHDAFTPLALAAAWTPTLRLGTAIVPVYTRGAARSPRPSPRCATPLPAGSPWASARRRT